jgi:hypothetical protein
MVNFRGSLDSDLEHHELIEACHIIFKKTVEPSGEKGLKIVVAKALADELEKVKRSEMHDRLFQEIPELAFRVLKEAPRPNCRLLIAVALIAINLEEVWKGGEMERKSRPVWSVSDLDR